MAASASHDTVPDDCYDVLLRRQMAQFFNATSDAILFLDREYRYTFLNRRARQLLDPDGALIGKTLAECFPDAVVPDSTIQKNFSSTMEYGVPTEFEAFYGAPLNMWAKVRTYPAEGGMIVFFHDITKEKTQEEEYLKKTLESERQLAEIEAVYRTAPIGLALFDVEDYRYLRLNDRQAAFFGLKPEDVVGRTLTEMAPIEGLRELFDQVRDGTPVVNYPLEGTLITDPNDYRYWTVSYFPVYGNDGNVQFITAASLEITQQKKAEKALIESEKLAVVGRLASSIAHEINNPLEAVTNLMFLARQSNNMDEVQQYLSMAEVELQRVAAISNQTLRFHKQASSPQEKSAKELLQSVMSIFQGRIANSGVDVQLDVRVQQPVRCFEGEIRQVLSNLVGNALDAMSTTGGKLVLRAHRGTNWKNEQRGIIFTIADNGCGMNAETQSKLFNAFYTTKGMLGTGLGLWVSREIIERHNGALRLYSSTDAVHHGTVFQVFLPFDAALR